MDFPYCPNTRKSFQGKTSFFFFFVTSKRSTMINNLLSLLWYLIWIMQHEYCFAEHRQKTNQTKTTHTSPNESKHSSWLYSCKGWIYTWVMNVLLPILSKDKPQWISHSLLLTKMASVNRDTTSYQNTTTRWQMTKMFTGRSWHANQGSELSHCSWP